MFKHTCFATLLLLSAFAPAEKPRIRVWLVGDSTLADKCVRAYPETGWGMPFAHFFDSTVVVDNRAKNGRSTKTFLSEGLWQSVMEGVKEGDYVLIQFGHNDEVKEKVGSYTTPSEFRANLARYVAETKSKKAIPVLISPVARRRFDSTGQVVESHPVYAAIVGELATQLGVPFIDLNKSSKALLQQFGPQTSKLLFKQLEPGEHPNYPDGVIDNTHFSELGARKMAQLVLADIRALKLELAERIVRIKKA